MGKLNGKRRKRKWSLNVYESESEKLEMKGVRKMHLDLERLEGWSLHLERYGKEFDGD